MNTKNTNTKNTNTKNTNTKNTNNMYKYAPYSYSKIATWQQCPRKFENTYIKKLPTQFEHSVPLDRGKLVHLIFEHKRDKEKIKNNKEFKEIVKRGLLDKQQIKNCFTIYDNFISSDIGKQLINKKLLFNEMPLGLDYALNIMEYNPKDPDLKDKLFLRGYIDAAYVAENPNAEKPEQDVLIVIDWKTGKYKEKEHQTWDQLLWYSLGMFSKMPFDKIILCYAYVEHNKLNLKEVKRTDINKYKNALYNTVDSIEQDTEFPKIESALCPYCPFYLICQED